MRIMIDTNIFISAILFPDSTPSKLVEKVLDEYQLVLCSQIIEELHEVFERKFKHKISCLENFLSQLSYELIYTPQRIDKKEYPDIKDQKDLPILVSSILGDVDYLITGDKGFFDVEIERPVIMTARKFLKKH